MTAKNYISTLVLIGMLLFAGIAFAGTDHNHEGDNSALKSGNHTPVASDLASARDSDADGAVMGYTSESQQHDDHAAHAADGEHAVMGDHADKGNQHGWNSGCGCDDK